MSRQFRRAGDVVVAQNGYSYTYVGDKELQRVLTHHLAGKEKYGRMPLPDERVVFIDGDRTNLDPSNIEYRSKGSKLPALKRQRVQVEERIRELQAQLEEIDNEIKDHENYR